MTWLHTCQQVSPRRHLAESPETLYTQPLQKGGASQNGWEGFSVTANQIRKLTWESEGGPSKYVLWGKKIIESKF